MEKTESGRTIQVTDESGNRCEATYPKRARGLVKHGRARYVDESTICLLRPPDHDSREDIPMSEEYIVSEANAGVINPDYDPANYIGKNMLQPPLTVRDVLNAILSIQQDSEYLHAAIEQVGKMGPVEAPGVNFDTRPAAIGDMVKAREETNRQMLALLNRMYDDLNASSNASDSWLDKQTLRDQMFQLLKDPDTEPCTRDTITDKLLSMLD